MSTLYRFFYVLFLGNTSGQTGLRRLIRESFIRTQDNSFFFFFSLSCVDLDRGWFSGIEVKTVVDDSQWGYPLHGL